MIDPVETTPAAVDPPKVTVDTSPIPGGATLLFRQIVIAVGGWAAARGYVAGDTVQMLVAVVPLVAAALWGQASRYLKYREAARAAASPHNPGVVFRDPTPIPPIPAG